MELLTQLLVSEIIGALSLNSKIDLSRIFPFECINSLQCYELTRRYSHLLFIQISPLTYAVYLWPVHCECAMKHNRRQIFYYLQIRDMCQIFV